MTPKDEAYPDDQPEAQPVNNPDNHLDNQGEAHPVDHPDDHPDNHPDNHPDDHPENHPDNHPDDPLVCITHLHPVVDGQNCQEGEKQMEKCKLCEETFKSKRELLSHLKIHKKKRIFEKTEAMEKSGENVQKKRKRSLEPILCPNCGSCFNSKILVTRHQRFVQ